ncbi:MAG: hypothetical protein M0P99_06030, partial [Candidatus Cloacimonetes bacterium]|nr:hypothetical protein [Candidatus Cloacimonadota bacterium]
YLVHSILLSHPLRDTLILNARIVPNPANFAIYFFEGVYMYDKQYLVRQYFFWKASFLACLKVSTCPINTTLAR